MLRSIFLLCVIVCFSNVIHAQKSKTGEAKEQKEYFAFAYVFGKDKTLLISNIEAVNLQDASNARKERASILSFRSANKPPLINYIKRNYEDIFNPAFDYTRIKVFEIGADRDALKAIHDEKISKSGDHHLLIDGFTFLGRRFDGPVPRRADMH